MLYVVYLENYRFRSHDAHDPEVQEQNGSGTGGRVLEHRRTGRRSVGRVLRAAVAVRARGPGNDPGDEPGRRCIPAVRRPVSGRLPDGGGGRRQTGRRRDRVRRGLRPVSNR